jgi:hypothetical protein
VSALTAVSLLNMGALPGLPIFALPAWIGQRALVDTDACSTW